MTYEQGDVVLAQVPYTDLTKVKQRPALILSGRTYNQSSQDYFVCPLTSNLSNTPHSVKVTPRDMVDGQLHKISLVKANHMFALHRSGIERVLGRVDPDIVKQVLQELQSILS